MSIQSVVFPRPQWSLARANKYIKDNGYKLSFYGKPVEIHESQYRFRQLAPHKFKNYTTKKLPNNVLLIIGHNYKMKPRG